MNTIPELIKIRQQFHSHKIENIKETVIKELSKISIKPDSNIAVAVGSRGINNILQIVQCTINYIKENNANPFIIPAMGSHGGATPDGQKKVLEEFGITEKSVNVPIKASMDVIELKNPKLKNRVFYSRKASKADGVIVINRIKPHTSFHGEVESGLAKMLAIGLGKELGAKEIHQYGVDGLTRLIKPTAKEIIKQQNIIFGLAIIEDAYDDTMLIKGLNPEEFEKEEPKLLQIAKKNMPKLPVEDIDILIIDEIGKNISGTGIDPNIIGRLKIDGIAEPEKPKIKKLILSDLTKETCGNAIGIGFADFITKKLYNKIDLAVTYKNVLTTTFTERAKIPIIAENDKKAITLAINTIGNLNDKQLKIIRIKNTLKLNEVYISKSIYDEIKNNRSIEVVEKYKSIINNKELTVF